MLRPPPRPAGTALDWTLAAAFAGGAAPRPALAAADAGAAAELAGRLGLGPRIADRLGRERLAAELGDAAAARLTGARTEAAARGLAVLECARVVARLAHGVDVPVAWLKFAGLAGAGVDVVGRRGAADLDLLVPETSARRLAEALGECGFTRSRMPQPEHQIATCVHPTLGALELHRYLPGVPGRARRRARPARFEQLRAAGLLAPADAVAAGTFAPVPALLAAHALVHGLEQHGESADYPHFRALADLADLGLPERLAAAEVAALLPPGAVAPLAAAAALLDALAAGRLPRAEPAGDAAAAALLDHLLALALDADYGAALKLGAVWRSTAEGGAAAGALGRLRRLFVISAAEVEAIYGPQPGRGAVLVRQLLRPFDLVRRALASLRSRRRLRRTPRAR